MTRTPDLGALERGHVVLAPDPFHTDGDRTRPWVIASTGRHPFDGEQYVAMGLTTRTWHDDRIPLDRSDYQHRGMPRKSSILPHAVTSLQPAGMTDYVCRISQQPVDRAVDRLVAYLR